MPGSAQSNGARARFQGLRLRQIRKEEGYLADPWPTEIRLAKDRRTLTVGFDTGETHALPAEYLRVFSPSAEVQGHSAEQRVTVGGKANVEILKVEPVGNYAVRLTFDDMHNTGIFTWCYLRKLGQEHARLWAGYVEELKAKGLTRQAAARG
jgi:DUF971 family protein